MSGITGTVRTVQFFVPVSGDLRRFSLAQSAKGQEAHQVGTVAGIAAAAVFQFRDETLELSRALMRSS
jgi:hypothetical protein